MDGRGDGLLRAADDAEGRGARRGGGGGAKRGVLSGFRRCRGHFEVDLGHFYAVSRLFWAVLGLLRWSFGQVTAIALLQHLHGSDRARAVLLQLPDHLQDMLSWSASWGKEGALHVVDMIDIYDIGNIHIIYTCIYMTYMTIYIYMLCSLYVIYIICYHICDNI